MFTEALSPENTTVIMIDYAIGFANLIRSHDITLHQNNALLLARTALDYKSGLVVTNGPSGKPSGPNYPKLQKILGVQKVIERGGMFDAFLFPEFSDAVAATNRRNLVIGGLMTEGCVLQTALGGARAGYEVYVAVDACGSQSKEIHDLAIQRLTTSGIKPVTTFALASEFQSDQSLPGADRFYKLMEEFNPELTFQLDLYQTAQKDAGVQAAGAK